MPRNKSCANCVYFGDDSGLLSICSLDGTRTHPGATCCDWHGGVNLLAVALTIIVVNAVAYVLWQAW